MKRKTTLGEHRCPAIEREKKDFDRKEKRVPKDRAD